MCVCVCVCVCLCVSVSVCVCMWEYVSSILLFQVTMDSVSFILTLGIQEMPMLLCSQG